MSIALIHTMNSMPYLGATAIHSLDRFGSSWAGWRVRVLMFADSYT
ncbi:MAG: hypothetical protein KME05_24960 [Gloeocapsa sp. UFS-A4-WI-NPMV-4B04]|nr:hypothetical protein [Gloeocapsa sp. UFS-A4-WI-NPMV-4B04]